VGAVCRAANGGPGFLDDPADYLEMLNSQPLRAARVVLDIGVHCQFDAPAEVGGCAWNYEKAWQLLTTHAARSRLVAFSPPTD
jgi:uncharacterized protein (DUF885 family)